MFRTKTSNDKKLCKERKHRIRLLILGVFRVGIKKHSKDNEKSIVKMEKPVRRDGLHTDRGVFRLFLSVLRAWKDHRNVGQAGLNSILS